MQTNRIHAWALFVFVVELIVAWAVGKALHTDDVFGAFALLVAFIAGLLFLLYLRREHRDAEIWV